MKNGNLFAAGLLLLASAAFADMDTSAEVVDAEFLDEFAFLEDAGMVESAALHRQEIGMSPSAITVLTREDIEASGATTITDLLRIVPGMDVITASPSYSGTSSRMYWTSENFYILVLIDGREANVELMGQAPWGLQPISLDDIERIEVLKGPQSSLYGANWASWDGDGRSLTLSSKRAPSCFCPFRPFPVRSSATTNRPAGLPRKARSTAARSCAGWSRATFRAHSEPRRFSRTLTSISAVLFSGLHCNAPRYSLRAL